jgi:hypothetical protein
MKGNNMSHTTTIDDQELFALATRLAGVTTVDLLKVRQEGDGLVVILVTGQKYRFDPGQIAAAIQNHLDNLAQGIDAVVRAQLVQPEETPAKKSARKSRPAH